MYFVTRPEILEGDVKHCVWRREVRSVQDEDIPGADFARDAVDGSFIDDRSGEYAGFCS